MWGESEGERKTVYWACPVPQTLCWAIQILRNPCKMLAWRELLRGWFYSWGTRLTKSWTWTQGRSARMLPFALCRPSSEYWPVLLTLGRDRWKGTVTLQELYWPSPSMFWNFRCPASHPTPSLFSDCAPIHFRCLTCSGRHFPSPSGGFGHVLCYPCFIWPPINTSNPCWKDDKRCQIGFLRKN